MPDDAASTPLLHPYHTVLILRLTFDQQHELYQGIVIEGEGQVVGLVRNWPELVTLLQQWAAARPTASR